MTIEIFLGYKILVLAGLSAICWIKASQYPKNAEEISDVFDKVLGVIVYRDLSDLRKATRWNKAAAVLAGLAVIAQVTLNLLGSH